MQCGFSAIVLESENSEIKWRKLLQLDVHTLEGITLGWDVSDLYVHKQLSGFTISASKPAVM